MSRTIALTDSQKSLVNTLPQQYINLNLGDACNVVLAYILSKAQDNIAMLTNGEIMKGAGIGSKSTLSKIFKSLEEKSLISRVQHGRNQPTMYCTSDKCTSDNTLLNNAHQITVLQITVHQISVQIHH